MDLISRQDTIKHLKNRLYETALNNYPNYSYYEEIADNRVSTWLNEIPSAQPHYCIECKWSRCRVNVDINGNTETYWHCLNWDGWTDEKGYCHKWEIRG